MQLLTQLISKKPLQPPSILGKDFLEVGASQLTAPQHAVYQRSTEGRQAVRRGIASGHGQGIHHVTPVTQGLVNLRAVPYVRRIAQGTPHLTNLSSSVDTCASTAGHLVTAQQQVDTLGRQFVGLGCVPDSTTEGKEGRQ